MYSILLADDEAPICAELQRTLRRFEFNVETVHTVEAALCSIREAQFDLILLEFNLRSELSVHPRAGNGLQLMHQLRASKVTAPILMFTAMEGEQYERAAVNAGADDFIQKTTPVPLLVSRLRSHIRRHERNSK